MKAAPKVLITDGWSRKALSAVRSLGERGVIVHVASHKRMSPPLYSQFTAKAHITPEPGAQPKKFAASILSILKKDGPFDAVFPLEESSMSALRAYEDEVRRLTQLPVASADSFAAANDKWETLRMARELKIPVPKSFLPKREHEVADAIAALGFPLVIKPVSSSGSRGMKKVQKKADFERLYRATVRKYGEPILQEALPEQGPGLGVGVLAQGGRIMASFSYKRLREFPVNGGPSTLRESTDDPVTKAYAARLIKELDWDGVAMVEFKTDARTGEPKLMEVNPRFWGSLELAAASGINFPYLLLQMAQGEAIPEQKYEVGVRCRWLFPGDIAHFITNAARFRKTPAFFKFFDKNLHYDDFHKDDRKGNIAVVACALLGVFDAENWKLGIFRD